MLSECVSMICCVKTPLDPQRVVDPIDQKIIAVLGRNARMTFAEIGAEVKLSASAVKRRIDRLEMDGIITGYTVLLNHAKLGRPIEAFAELRFSGDTKVDDIAGIADHVDGVQAVFTTAGDPDAIVWLRVRDVEELKSVIDLIRRTGKVIGTKTLMVLGRSEKNNQANKR
jgi:Lrp/AsnC family transcriptional regulator, leucine-responsive regulatory protein